MAKKKNRSIEILPPIQKKTSEERNKNVKVPQKFGPELSSLIKQQGFRGIWIFATRDLYDQWMMIHYTKILNEYRGTYNALLKKWFFPWGATLDLQIMEKGEDFEKLRGMHFSWVELTGKVDEEIQCAAIEVINSMWFAKK